MGAHLAGAETIIVIDPVEAKREGAREFGATHTLAPSDDSAAQVRELTDGYGVDYAIDTVGAPGILSQAFEATVPGGTIVCVGVPGPEARPDLPGPDLVRKEKIVTGSLYGSSRPPTDIPAIGKLYRGGSLPLDKLITKTYPLKEINTAFADMKAGKLNRGVIILDEAIAW